MPEPNSREFLLDVSRLIWRLWSRRLPTGIDRVCLEYLAHFAARSQAVVQRKGRVWVLPADQSDRLFALLGDPAAFSRADLARFAAGALWTARSAPPRASMTYLNVGHTGLDSAGLAEWVARHRVQAIYLVHDLIPITHPEFCRPGETARHTRRMEHLLTSGFGVIANSQATLDDLAAFAARHGLPMPSSVVALISGVRPVETGPRNAERPYFVTLGTIEGRKNHLLLLQVWRRLIERHGAEAPLLVIIGQRGWEAQAATAMLDRLPLLKDHVRELSHCTDQELAGWLRGARALLMPTFAEGFGLPVIEALQVGTPVVASDLPVFREVAGTIPLYLDPLDGPAWERAVLAMASSEAERQRQAREREGYQAPTWEQHFRIVDQWLEGHCRLQPSRNGAIAA